MNSYKALQRLKEGNQRFVSEKHITAVPGSELRMLLSEGQAPYAIILSCADSRVVPELMFDVSLGEVFIIRVAGNIANISSIASIEYAVANLDTKLIIVLGHESCGAVTAAMEGGDQGQNLNHLLSHIQPAIDQAGEGATISDVAKINAELGVNNLINNSQIIRDAVEKRGVKIVPAFYHLSTGVVDFYESPITRSV